MELDDNGSSSSEDSSGFDDICLNTVFITLKVQLSTGTKLLEELQQKYIAFFTSIMEADKSIIVETADPDKKGDLIRTRDDFPAEMTGISSYFYSSGKLPKNNPKSDNPSMVWATARISLDGK